jgi:hypothetical protein
VHDARPTAAERGVEPLANGRPSTRDQGRGAQGYCSNVEEEAAARLKLLELLAYEGVE